MAKTPNIRVQSGISLKWYLYGIWLLLALSLRYDTIPSLTALLQSTLYDPGIGSYTLTPFSLYTYYILGRTSWMLSNFMLNSVEQASRSSVLTIFAAVIILLGVIAAADIGIAYARNGDLFLLQGLYNVIVSPPTVDQALMYGLDASGDLLINQTDLVNQSVNITL